MTRETLFRYVCVRDVSVARFAVVERPRGARRQGKSGLLERRTSCLLAKARTVIHLGMIEQDGLARSREKVHAIWRQLSVSRI